MPTPSCYDKALDLLARRPHFAAELVSKLATRGYPAEQVEETLRRLRERRLVDDLATAREFVGGRLRRGALGRRRLAADLVARGVAREVIDQVLLELLPDDDLELARQAAERWPGRGRRDAAALARHLASRGFSQRAILRLVAEHAESSDDDPLAADDT